MTNQDKYNINFFNPLTEHARANKNLIAILATVWAIAVFGFHFLLIFVSTPTAEETLEKFNSVWPQVVENNNSTTQMQQTFAKSMLMVLGKNIAVKDNHKAVLKESLSWMVYNMQPDSVKPIFMKPVNDETLTRAATSIGLKSEGFEKIMKDLLPTSITEVESPTLKEETKNALPAIMELYLIHNQSFLTDFTFLGFPFHYWYSAQFLLILFVVLCLIYAVAIDKLNAKYEFIEET